MGQKRVKVGLQFSYAIQYLTTSHESFLLRMSEAVFPVDSQLRISVSKFLLFILIA